MKEGEKVSLRNPCAGGKSTSSMIRKGTREEWEMLLGLMSLPPLGLLGVVACLSHYVIVDLPHFHYNHNPLHLHPLQVLKHVSMTLSDPHSELWGSYYFQFLIKKPTVKRG